MSCLGSSLSPFDSFGPLQMIKAIKGINIADFVFKSFISVACPLLSFGSPEEMFLIDISERLHYQPCFHG